MRFVFRRAPLALALTAALLALNLSQAGTRGPRLSGSTVVTQEDMPAHALLHGILINFHPGQRTGDLLLANGAILPLRFTSPAQEKHLRPGDLLTVSADAHEYSRLLVRSLRVQGSGSHWSGGHWTGSHWSGGHWSGGHWSGGHWSGGHWTGRQWDGGHWAMHGVVRLLDGHGNAELVGVNGAAVTFSSNNAPVSSAAHPANSGAMSVAEAAEPPGIRTGQALSLTVTLSPDGKLRAIAVTIVAAHVSSIDVEGTVTRVDRNTRLVTIIDENGQNIAIQMGDWATRCHVGQAMVVAGSLPAQRSGATMSAQRVEMEAVDGRGPNSWLPPTSTPTDLPMAPATLSPTSTPISSTAVLTATSTPASSVVPPATATVHPSATAPNTLALPTATSTLLPSGTAVTPTNTPVRTATTPPTSMPSTTPSVTATSTAVTASSTPGPVAPVWSAINLDASSITATAGQSLWFSSVVAVTSPLTTPATCIVNSATVSFTVAGAPYALAVPEADLVYSPTASTATTGFSSTANTWTTTATGAATSYFLSGLAWTAPVSISANMSSVTWTSRFVCSTPGITVSWRGAVASYSQFPGSYVPLNINPVETPVGADMDYAGTPENWKGNATGTAHGLPGSTYIGQYSSSAIVSF